MFESAIIGTTSVTTEPALTGTVDDEGQDNYPTGSNLTIIGTNSSIVLDANTGDPDTILMIIDENGTVTSGTIWTTRNLLFKPTALNSAPKGAFFCK